MTAFDLFTRFPCGFSWVTNLFTEAKYDKDGHLSPMPLA